LGALESYFNRKYYYNKKQQQQLFFSIGVTENGTQKTLPLNVFLIFFKLGKVVEDYHFLLLSKPLEGENL
jgi:hypothetical protein